MGRPRVHDESTAAQLLRAAEEMLQENGLGALSMRALAARVGLTTRAIYSLFASKEQLLAALAARGFALLGEAVAHLPVTDDPEQDLVEAGLAFRGFALAHPSLYRLAFGPHRPAGLEAQRAARAQLDSRVARVAGRELPHEELMARVLTVHALCEGLAALELRGALPEQSAERAWRSALVWCARGIREA